MKRCNNLKKLVRFLM